MEKEVKNKEMESDMTVYEVGYTLLPSLAVEQVPARVDALKEIVEKAGGVVISLENPVLIDLAYPMTKVIQTVRHKCTSGYFGWVKFEMPAEGISTVKKALDADDNILRYILFKTVRENTLLHGQMMFQKEEVKGDEPAESEATVDTDLGTDAPATGVPEEIDKSIDNLVIA